MHTNVDELEKNFTILQKIDSKGYLWNCLLGAIIFAVSFDVAPAKYWNPILEDIFTYDLGLLVSVGVVAWTYTTTLIIYILERMEVRQYGIAMRDIIFMDMNKRQSVKLLCLLFGELLLLILGTIGEWYITVVIIALSQFIIMVYVLGEIWFKNNHKYVLFQLKREFDNSIQGEGEQSPRLMNQMINRLDYEQNDNLNELLEVLCGIVSVRADAYLKNQSHENKKKVNTICCQITENILNMGKSSEKVYLLLQNWFLNEKTPLEVKQGIMMALLNRLNPSVYREIQKMLGTCQDDYRKLWLWNIVYNIKLQKKVNEEWRSRFSEYMMNMIRFKEDKDMTTAVAYWRQMEGRDEREGCHVLFESIFAAMVELRMYR